jgi:hypothetical protein
MNVCRRLVAVVAAMLMAGCASAPYSYREPTYVEKIGPGTVLRSLATDTAIEDKILALDPEHLTEADVHSILAAGPAPRIMNLHGGLVGVHLVLNSFVRFLVAMGYPEAKIRNPRDGELTWTPYADGAQQAGVVAWFYEKEGMRPLLIGHSQGGVQAIKILDELAGLFGDEVPVWNPLTDSAEDRTVIVDPLTGRSRPVVGLSVAYVSVVGAGGTALWMPNQWNMAGRLDAIPDNVDEFTGFYIELDFIALDFPGAADGGKFHGVGATQVRNVRLPANYSHIGIAVTEHLARDPRMRAWVDAYRPDARDLAPIPDGDSENILWAADVWYGIKKHWCIEAQRLIRARRALADKAAAPG